MTEFLHQRHQPPTSLERPRELIVACVPMRSNINLSHIVRVAGCCGVRTVICCGAAKIIDKIARDGADSVEIADAHRTPSAPHRTKTPGPSACRLSNKPTGSQNLHHFAFPRNAVLVVGNERLGLEPDVLRLLDHVVEIPIYGLPYSYNVATATSMALYEYCRQYPQG